MEASELMIGDWVIAKKVVNSYGKTKPEITKVTNILEDGINAYYAYGELEDYIEENLIEPIPLTEEILKANRFIHKDTMDEWWHEEYDLTWGMQMSDFELTDEFMFGRAKITYVHELQHALRLCGLQKLADNFKVEL